MYLCLNCGNEESFRELAHGHENFSEMRFLDKEDNLVDTGDRDYVESEITDLDKVTCDKCESENVEDLNENEIIEQKWYHLSKTGKWWKKEIAEKNRDIQWKNKLVLEAI